MTMEIPKLLCKIDLNVFKANKDSKAVFFKKPRLVAFYEWNYNTVEPAKKIFYFQKPESETYPINLNLGYDTYTKRQDSNLTSLQVCLKYAMSSEPKISAENVDKIKIFTVRGTLVDLMEICYKKKRQECWVRVSRYNGNLYVVRENGYETSSSELKEQDVRTHLEPKKTHNRQFLKNVFTESPSTKPNINEPEDANKALIGVYQSSFGEFEIMYSGSVYGIEAEEEFKDFDDLEALNTCRFVMAKQMWYYCKKNPVKYLNYWLQAYLINATDLYFAYKSSDGFVCEPIVHKRLSDLPKEFNHYWKPSICTGFLYKFLQDVNKLMSKDNINSLTTVYEFHVDLSNRIITYKIFKDKPEMILVTQDYMEHCQVKL